MSVGEGWYTSVEAAEILHCGRSTVLAIIAEGRLKSYEVSPRGDKRILREELVAFMNRQQIPIELLERYEAQRTAKRVLVIEDNKNYAERVTAAITADDRRLEVRIARSGAEGAILLGEFRPQILLVDWKLPDMTSERFLEMVREKRKELDAKVVMMSARSKNEIAPGGEIEEKMRCLGVDQFIYKFEKVSTIRDAVLERLNLRERRAGRVSKNQEP